MQFNKGDKVIYTKEHLDGKIWQRERNATIVAVDKATDAIVITFDDTSYTTERQTLACYLRARAPPAQAAERSGIRVFAGDVPAPPSGGMVVVVMMMLMIVQEVFLHYDRD